MHAERRKGARMKIKSTSFGQRLSLGLIFVLIFSYTLYHMVGLFGEEIETFAAGVTTEKTVLSENGYVFRDETVLTSSFGGVVDYQTENGVKVSKGQALATVYEDGTVETRETIARLDRQIALLEKSFGESLSAVEMGELKQSVGYTYDLLVKMMATGDTGELSKRVDEFLIGLNQMDGLIQGERAQGYATLDALRAERQQILDESGFSQTYTAAETGYFYTQVDGYEDEFTMEAAQTLTVASFYNLLDQKSASLPIQELAYGKICDDSEWLLVLPIETAEQRYFKEGNTYSAEFFQNNHTVLPMTLDRIIESEEDGALLVFRTDRLPQNFSFDRCQSVRFEVDRVSGIYVPRNIVERVSGGYRGVYVLRGNVVYFRRIEIVYQGSDYYLVKDGIEDAENPYLQVNDLIILNGKNMFDGRVLD